MIGNSRQSQFDCLGAIVCLRSSAERPEHGPYPGCNRPKVPDELPPLEDVTRMDRRSIERLPTDKTVEIVIIGRPVSSDRASEIIRRTDFLFFARKRSLSDYALNVRRAVGFPEPRSGEDPNGAAYRARLLEFRLKWGSVPLNWLSNAMVLAHDGWCHPDGTIALVETSGRYPLATDYFDDCLALAEAFPDLELDVAIWGPWRILPHVKIEYAPRSPWSDELKQQVQHPTFGFSVQSGQVSVVDGRDWPVMMRRASALTELVETTLETCRRQRLASTSETCFGDRNGRHGVPDQFVQPWLDHARILGLLQD